MGMRWGEWGLQEEIQWSVQSENASRGIITARGFTTKVRTACCASVRAAARAAADKRAQPPRKACRLRCGRQAGSRLGSERFVVGREMLV